MASPEGATVGSLGRKPQVGNLFTSKSPEGATVNPHYRRPFGAFGLGMGSIPGAHAPGYPPPPLRGYSRPVIPQYESGLFLQRQITALAGNVESQSHSTNQVSSYAVDRVPTFNRSSRVAIPQYESGLFLPL